MDENVPAATAKETRTNSALHVRRRITVGAGWPPQVETIVLNICSIDKVKDTESHCPTRF